MSRNRPWNRDEFRNLIAPSAIGMVHLPALPGSPNWTDDPGLKRTRKQALGAAEALVEGGFNAVMIENFGDIPFFPGRVPAETAAAMSVLISAIATEFPDLKLGVNVLRNDVDTALGIAAATGAAFVRVNIHVGAAVTDQGTIEGQAANTLRARNRLGLQEVGILADLRVKHARPLVERPLAEEAKDLRLRGLADAIIVSGVATGSGANPEELRAVREAMPDCPLVVGSGMTRSNLELFSPWADGYIVGTSLQEPALDGGQPVVSAQRSADFLSRLNSLENGG